MGSHPNAALHDVHQRLQPQVAARRHPVGPRIAAVLIPRCLVLLRCREGGHIGGLHALPRVGEAPLPVGVPVLARDVFAQGELHGLRSTLEQDLLHVIHAPAGLDDRALCADRIAAAVQHLGRRHAARERPVDREALLVERVHCPNLGHERGGALVDGPHRDVRVLVDQARNGREAGSLDQRHVARCLEVRSDAPNHAVPNEDRDALIHRVVGRPHGVEVADEEIPLGNLDRALLDLRPHLRGGGRREQDRDAQDCCHQSNRAHHLTPPVPGPDTRRAVHSESPNGVSRSPFI